MCRKNKHDYLIIYDKKRIPYLLRLLNLCLSDKIIDKWLEHFKSKLEYSKEERRHFELKSNKIVISIKELKI
jgi:hypothetical protein